jgi:N-formylglutamate amidohydrolase
MVNVKIKKNVSTLDYNLDCSCPIIISIPHSGTNYSKSFINKTILNKNELQYSEDS